MKNTFKVTENKYDLALRVTQMYTHIHTHTHTHTETPHDDLND